MSSSGPASNPTATERLQRFAAASVRAFHVYAGWLVSLTWRRFIAYALLLVIVVAILHDMPPFTWTFTERTQIESAGEIAVPPPPRPPKAPKASDSPIRIETPGKGERAEGVDISIGKDGIKITPKVARPGAPAASAAASAAASSASTPAAQTPSEAAAAAADAAEREILIQLPPGTDREAIREAIVEVKREIEQAVREARQEAEAATREAEAARREAEAELAQLTRKQTRNRTAVRTTRWGIGDFLMQFTLLWVFASALLKAVYKGRMQAEVKAAQATETAESESLKRQVVEARMAAMQAQVEPHFLFNTLASIDHLIETDPPRASLMQKNLIALLRASMPSMREVNGGGGSGAPPRDLGRELAVIRPYLEILKVRMEERLATEIRVSDGLLSAEFPPMMLQSLVENAIKHGLEPKAEGGQLVVSAEIVHGKLAVSVADTGLGFGKAATAGTGIGLSNIRERLQLLYGNRASLRVSENPGGGTAVTITVPYLSTSLDQNAA
jgi:signal transduction histidine kinase